MVQNVQYLNCPPIHVTLLFDYRTPILSGIQMNLVFKLFSIQMVTVLCLCMTSKLLGTKEDRC